MPRLQRDAQRWDLLLANGEGQSDFDSNSFPVHTSLLHASNTNLSHSILAPNPRWQQRPLDPNFCSLSVAPLRHALLVRCTTQRVPGCLHMPQTRDARLYQSAMGRPHPRGRVRLNACALMYLWMIYSIEVPLYLIGSMRSLVSGMHSVPTQQPPQ